MGMLLKNRRKPMFRRVLIIDDERGMALLITIMTLSLLIAVTIQFSRGTWHKFVVSDNLKREVQLKSIAESGINIALVSLQNDLHDNQSDSLTDRWTLIEQENFASLFAAGELKLKVTDLSGKLQINSMAENENTGAETENSGLSTQLRTILFNLLVSGDFPVENEIEAKEIVDAIVDWIDEDDQESDHGAETSYYQSLDPPYSAKNGPVTNIEELLLVRGVTPELFFGSKDTMGLKDLLTVYGDNGKVNINTAESIIVRGMNPLISESIARQFDEYRRDAGNSDQFNDPGWYRNIGWPGDIELNTELLTTKSRYFQITAKAGFDTLARTIVADVERNEDGTITLLKKKVE